MTGYKTVTSYIGRGKKKRKVTRRVPQFITGAPQSRQRSRNLYLGAHKNEDKEVAMRENAPMLRKKILKKIMVI